MGSETAPDGTAEEEPKMDSDALIAALRTVLPDGPVPLHEPEFAGNEWDYVKACIDDGWVSSVARFE